MRARALLLKHWRRGNSFSWVRGSVTQVPGGAYLRFRSRLRCRLAGSDVGEAAARRCRHALICGGVLPRTSAPAHTSCQGFQGRRFSAGSGETIPGRYFSIVATTTCTVNLRAKSNLLLKCPLGFKASQMQGDAPYSSTGCACYL